jgi:hypothetical protein
MKRKSMLSLGYLAFGSAIIALLMAWQVKTVAPNSLDILKFNAYIIIPIWIANSALGIGFIKAQDIFKSFPLTAAVQTFFYYIFLTIASYYLGRKTRCCSTLFGVFTHPIRNICLERVNH